MAVVQDEETAFEGRFKSVHFAFVGMGALLTATDQDRATIDSRILNCMQWFPDLSFITRGIVFDLEQRSVVSRHVRPLPSAS